MSETLKVEANTPPDVNKLVARFESLIQKYKDTYDKLNDYEKAELERDIYDARIRSASDAAKQVPAKTLKQLLGGTIYDYRNRRDLLNAGPTAMPLWELVNRGEMAVTTAVRLHRGAKHLTSSGVSLADAVKTVLGEYDGLLTKHLPNGKILKTHSPARLPSRDATQPKKRTKNFYSDLRDLVARMRDLVLSFSSDRLGKAGVSEIAIRNIVERFEIDVQTNIEELQAALNAAVQSERRMQVPEVSRRQIVDACRSLAMDPPPPGKPVDAKLAKQQKKRHVRLYHPDAHAGSEIQDKLRPQYEAVLDAYRTIVRYNDDLTSSGRNGRSSQATGENNS